MKLTLEESTVPLALPENWGNALAMMRSSGQKEPVTLFFGGDSTVWLVRESKLVGYETMRFVGLPGE